jgi:hypothetical protein
MSEIMVPLCNSSCGEFVKMWSMREYDLFTILVALLMHCVKPLFRIVLKYSYDGWCWLRASWFMLESRHTNEMMFEDDKDERSESICVMNSLRWDDGVVPGGGEGDLYTELILNFLPWMTTSIVRHSKVLGMKVVSSSTIENVRPLLM